MRFFVGLHHPSAAAKVGHPAFISVNALRGRRSGFAVGDWILDSGAFTTIAQHGCYPDPVRVYADQVRRWSTVGRMVAAVAQDWMCEPAMLARTGLDVATHQRYTLERYDELVIAGTGATIMPVLQGWHADDYLRHLELYGVRLRTGHYVGVGTLCKRQGNPSHIAAILQAVHRVRPDLRLHGFGLKITSLAHASVRDHLWSADSMAWSWDASMDLSGRGNDPAMAQRFADRVSRQHVQQDLPGVPIL